jgi:hypothetical protein
VTAACARLRSLTTFKTGSAGQPNRPLNFPWNSEGLRAPLGSKNSNKTQTPEIVFPALDMLRLVRATICELRSRALRRRWILLVVLLCPVSAFATTIVVVRTANFILIAADSKATWRGGTGPSTVCKIYRSGDLYFAIGGLEHDGARGFYVKDLVADGFKSVSRFEARVTAAQQEISPRFLVRMNRLRAEDPNSFKFEMTDPGPQLSVAFAQMENGVPLFAVRGFEYFDAPSPRVEISGSDCPGTDCPGGVTHIEYMGKQNAIKAYYASHDVWKMDPVVLARKLVELEIQDEPSSVGPPIAILRLDSSGATWISNGCGCPIETP